MKGEVEPRKCSRNGMMLAEVQMMNRTVGIAMLISGLFFGLCGVLCFTGADASPLPAAVKVDTALFCGGGLALFVVGLLLLNDVRMAPPGSLMVRRGQAGA